MAPDPSMLMMIGGGKAELKSKVEKLKTIGQLSSRAGTESDKEPKFERSNTGKRNTQSATSAGDVGATTGSLTARQNFINSVVQSFEHVSTSRSRGVLSHEETWEREAERPAADDDEENEQEVRRTNQFWTCMIRKANGEMCFYKNLMLRDGTFSSKCEMCGNFRQATVELIEPPQPRRKGNLDRFETYKLDVNEPFCAGPPRELLEDLNSNGYDNLDAANSSNQNMQEVKSKLRASMHISATGKTASMLAMGRAGALNLDADQSVALVEGCGMLSRAAPLGN